MSKRNTRAAKAARRAARQQKQARTMIPVPGIPDMVLPAVLEVQLDRMEDEDEEGPYVTWVAEWGLQDDGVGVTDGNEDLQQLIAHIAEDVRSWAGQRHLSIEWEIGGDAPAGQTVEDMIAAEGVVLPSAFPF